jgi:hypothetical protein
VRKIVWVISGFWLCGLLVAARAGSFQLTDGTTLTGDIVVFNDSGITFRMADDNYTNVMWTKFSQDALRQLSKSPKIEPFVEPFIEIPESERPKKPEIEVRDVTRLELPPDQSLLGALLSSTVGLFVLLVIYAANLYAGYEIAVVRARPVGLVIGLAAVLPVLGPIIFLSLPMRVAAAAPESAEEPAEARTFNVPGQTELAATAPGEVHVSQASLQKVSHPEPQVFQRGQFTFNRRFLETKFSNFFGMTRREADRDMVLSVKTTAGVFVVQRISRIAANEAHFEIVQGVTRREIMVPFADIQEIRLKHKDA